MEQHSGQSQEQSRSAIDSEKETINRWIQEITSDHSNLSQQQRITSSQINEGRNQLQQLLTTPIRNQDQGNDGYRSIFDLPELVEDPQQKKIRFLPMPDQPSSSSGLKDQPAEGATLSGGEAPVKQDAGGILIFKPGMCALRFMNYQRQMQQRPQDNNIEFWRNFVSEFFDPDARKKLCVSSYGEKPDGVLKKGELNCNICKKKPSQGFEITTEILPRLCKIKYDNGIIREFYHLLMPVEYKNASDQLVLQCAKVTHETVYQNLRVLREGHLKIAFSPDMKICSWEFCVRCHDELIPRKELLSLASELGLTAKGYRDAKKYIQSPIMELEANTCERLLKSADQLTRALLPFVNELGYEKQYVRCLQTAEICCTMKDIMDYSSTYGTGPKDAMVRFTQSFNSRKQNSGQNSSQASSFQLSSQISQEDARNPTNQLIPYAGPSTYIRSAAQTTTLSTMKPSSSKVPMHAATSSSSQGGGEPSNSLAILQDYLNKNPNLGKNTYFEEGTYGKGKSIAVSSKSNVQPDHDDFEERWITFLEGQANNASKDF